MITRFPNPSGLAWGFSPLQWLASATILFLLFATIPSRAQTHEKQSLPYRIIGFEENRGQFLNNNGDKNDDVLYVLQDQTVTLYFHSSGITYEWRNEGHLGSVVDEATGTFVPSGSGQPPIIQDRSTLTMEWIGANPDVQILEEEPLPSYTNYYLDHCADGILNVRKFQRLIYKDIYPNTDVVYYLHDGRVKYDVILHPGARMRDVRYRYRGDHALTLEGGGLKLSTKAGFLQEQQPVGWNESGSIPFDYFVDYSQSTVSFTSPLISPGEPVKQETTIDPLLIWGSYLGGTSVEYGYGTAIDPSGNVYMTGWAQSTNAVATAGAHQQTPGGSADAFLAKFNPSGTLLWCTYYGGAGEDVGRDIVIDASGNVYLAGQTASNTAMSAGSGFQTIFGGGVDAFVAKFTNAGARIWGTYLGGAGNDYGRELLISGSTVYLMGYAGSNTGVATAGSHQPAYGGGASDSFVASISDAGTLNWCSYFGGPGDEESWAGDLRGSVLYLAGNTTSNTGIASAGSYQTSLAGSSDAFIATFSTTGAFQGATYYGGSDEDVVRGFQVDGNGNMYVSGQTRSFDGIASPGSHQSGKAGTAAEYDAFLAKFGSIDTRLWSTYIGGTGNDVGRGVVVDDGNNVYQVGNTNSTTGIAQLGYQDTYGGGVNDGFVVKFDPTGNLRWGTYYGATGDDFFIAATIEKNTGRLILVGQTTSTTAIATPGTHQTIFGGNWDAYIVVMDGTETTLVYSRQDGTWVDANTWSNVGHTGPGGAVISTGTDVIIGNGNTITLTADDGLAGNQLGLVIDAGATLDANGFNLSVMGPVVVNGAFINGSLSGSYQLYSEQSFVTFEYLNYGIEGFPGAPSVLNTNVVILQGSTAIDGGTLDTNGYDVCDASVLPPTSPVFTSPQSTAVTLSWTAGASSAFVVARAGSTSVQPQFGIDYGANAVFGSGDDLGSGNFVVYKGSGTSVTITGLSPETTYEFDLYSYSTLIGGCYSVSNYQFATFTTCASIPAPANAVDGSYCTGDPIPTIRVDTPPAGYSINWFSDAAGTLPASGSLSGAGNEIFTTSTPGTYYTQLEETASGCTSATLTEVALTEHPALVAGTASSNTSVCTSGDPAVLDGGTPSGGTGSYTYQWESASVSGGPYTLISGAIGATYDPPSGIMATTFFRRMVYSASCSTPGSEIEVTVTAPPVITVEPSSQEVCEDGSATFNITATGAALTHRWQVDDGSGFNDIADNAVYAGSATNALQISDLSGLNNARYRCIVTSGGLCSVSSAVGVLTVNTLPSVAPQSATLCEAIAGSGIATVNLTALDAAVTGGAAGTSVTWFADAALTIPVAAPSTASASNGTVFHARVSNADLCIAATGVTIGVNAKPQVTGVTDVSICSGTATSITFNSNLPATTYTWSVTITASISGAANGSGSGINQTLTNISTSRETAAYDITPRANGCDGALFRQTVFVDPIPTPFTVSGGAEICTGSTGTTIGLSNSQPGVTYTLVLNNVPTATTATPGGGQFDFPNITAAGTYTITGATSIGCENQMSGSAVVTVNTVPSGGTLASADSEICVGESTTFTVSNVIGSVTSLTWILPAGVAESSRTGNSITVSGIDEGTGNISVTPVNACGNGSVLTASIAVSQVPDVVINSPSEIYMLEEAVFSFTSAVSPLGVAWDFGDGQTSTEHEATVSYSNEGAYTVTVEIAAPNNCSNTASREVNVMPQRLIDEFAIKNVVTANGDGHNDKLYIDGIERFPENEVIVIDRWGSEVYRKKNYSNEWDLRKNDKYIPAGNYVCIIRYNGKVFSRTVTVLKDN